MSKRRHDHRQSLWLMAFGVQTWVWCYQCGAWKFDQPGQKWNRPSGIGGPNPAMRRG